MSDDRLHIGCRVVRAGQVQVRLDDPSECQYHRLTNITMEPELHLSFYTGIWAHP